MYVIILPVYHNHTQKDTYVDRINHTTIGRFSNVTGTIMHSVLHYIEENVGGRKHWRI